MPPCLNESNGIAAAVVTLVLVVVHVPIMNAGTDVARNALSVKSAWARAEFVPAVSRRRKKQLERINSKNWTMPKQQFSSGMVRCSFSERLASRSHRLQERT